MNTSKPVGTGYKGLFLYAGQTPFLTPSIAQALALAPLARDFTNFSQRIASALLLKPDKYIRILQLGAPDLVLRAPPTISRLCCLRRLLGSVVQPT